MVNRILSAIGWLGTALVVAAVAIRFGYPAKGQYAYYAAWAGLVCVLLYTLSQWREIGRAFGKREARYGSLAATSVLIVLGILIAINYIGVKQNKRWDLTADKVFSLSDQTRKALASLDAPLEMLVFDKETDFPRYQDSVRNYEYGSKNVKVSYIDPDKQPTAAKQNNVQQYGTIVLNYKGRTSIVTSDQEQDLTNGIIKVTTGTEHKVLFTTGHGEKDTASTERDGYSGIVAALKGENYTVDKVVLAQTPEVPKDTSMLVIAGPRVDFLPQEIDSVKKYLDNYGKVLLELDPPDKPGDPPLTNLVALAHDYGMDVGNDMVVDPQSRMMNAEADVPFAASYPQHKITERFNVLTLYPLVRSVTPVPGGVNGRTAQPLVETSQASWAETDLKALLTQRQAAPEPDKGDKPGPVSIAAAVSYMAPPPSINGTPEGGIIPSSLNDGTKPETRMVVVGDSDFGSNSAISVAGNKDLFLNMASWLAQQENLISIRPKEAGDSRLTMTAQQQQMVVIASLLLIPGFVFGTGVFAWWKRR